MQPVRDAHQRSGVGEFYKRTQVIEHAYEANLYFLKRKKFVSILQLPQKEVGSISAPIQPAALLDRGVEMTKHAIVSPRLAAPVGPFSQAIRINGFLFLSGQVGQNPATGRLVEGGVEHEAEQVLDNLAVVLAAAGKGFSDVVRAGVFLTDMKQFDAVNAVYARHFEQPYPARTTVAVAALPLGACVEIDLVVQA